MRAACFRRGDLDALRVRIRLPGVLLPCWIKDTPDELAAMPREVRDVFPGEKHDTSLIWQCVRQNEPSAMGHDGRV